MSDFFQFQDFECEGNKWLASNHVKKATRPAKTRVAFLQILHDLLGIFPNHLRRLFKSSQFTGCHVNLQHIIGSLSV